MSKPAIYPDGLAELCKGSTGEKYRPSNGTEGEIFMAAWCHNCADWDEGRCQTALATMAYDEDDPEYPAEWRIGADGQPECIAFNTELATEPDRRTIDLFEALP